VARPNFKQVLRFEFTASYYLQLFCLHVTLNRQVTLLTYYITFTYRGGGMRPPGGFARSAPQLPGYFP